MENRRGISRAAIVHGSDSDVSQNGAVLVMLYDALAKGGGAAAGCTGSLLTPRLVLTARHCVADTDAAAACNSEGKPVAGGEVKADHPASAVYVFGGKDRPDFLSGTAKPSKGLEILTTGAKTLCNNDIALVLLDRPLEGANIVPIKLDAKPAKKDKVTVIGWGIADDSPNPQSRRQRTDVEILDVGPGSSVGPAEFRIGEGTCQGDSGGPAIAASGAVLGALSRGGNTTGGQGVDACLDATNIYSSVAGHADFILAGYEKAGQEPWLEGQPNPLLATNGGVCALDADCRSNTCNPLQKTCAQDCAQSACGDGFVCSDQGSKRVCLENKKDEDEGCNASGFQRSHFNFMSSSGAMIAFAVAVLLRWARSKK